MTRKYNYPSCNKATGVDIVYGMPSPELFEKSERGEIALGGCVVEENQPIYRCLDCGFEWNKEQHFEAAKQKWLKEYVKGRSWVEMMDDNDRAADEKAKKLMTPEYLKMWADASKDDKKK